jgi:cobalt-zinc-cadmium efflux system membrane fusion protein
VKRFVPIVALAWGIAACGAGDAQEAPEVAQDESTAPLGADALAHLTIAPVEPSDALEPIVFPGRIEFRPEGAASIGAAVDGRVVTIAVRPGQSVAAGDALLTLESEQAAAARSALEQASAELVAAESSSDRQDEMMRLGVGLEVERSEARARLRTARAEAGRARRAVELVGAGAGSLVTLTAPSDGVVLAIDAALGAVVQPGEEIVRIGDPSKLWVVVEIPDSSAARLATGIAAEVRVGVAGRERVLTGRVEGVGAQIDTETRRLPVFVALDGDATGIAASTSAEVRLALPGVSSLRLPATAVLIKEGTRRVAYVEIEPGRFEERDLDVGPVRGGHVAVYGGLRPGERVVMRGALLIDRAAGRLL